MDYNTDFEILQDVNNNTGKKINWVSHKKDSLLLSESYTRLGNERKSFRVSECATVLNFKRFDDGTMKLHQVGFCKVRLCPMCSWRRSLKIFGQVSKVMDKLQEDKSYNFIFLTLTIANCEDNKLSETIDKLYYAFKLLSYRKEFKSAVKGYFRCLEVTYNFESNTFHPHFHCVLVVNPNYFNQPTQYISQKKWSELWQKCLRVDYVPVVDVRKFKESDKGVGKEVAEVAKYAVKPTEYLIKDLNGNISSSLHKKLTDYLVSVYDGALCNRRLVAFGGIMKIIHKSLNLDDVNDDNSDLVNTDADDVLRPDLHYVIVSYKWGIGAVGGNYYKLPDEIDKSDFEEFLKQKEERKAELKVLKQRASSSASVVSADTEVNEDD